MNAAVHPDDSNATRFMAEDSRKDEVRGRPGPCFLLDACQRLSSRPYEPGEHRLILAFRIERVQRFRLRGAKKTLVISRALRVGRGPAKQLGLTVTTGSKFWADLKMSPFLHDIMGLLPAAIPGDSWGGCVPQ